MFCWDSGTVDTISLLDNSLNVMQMTILLEIPAPNSHNKSSSPCMHAGPSAKITPARPRTLDKPA